MARIILKLITSLFYFFVFLFLSHQTMSQPLHMHTACDSSDNFTQSSSYESNRATLFSSLLQSSSLQTYSNSTIGPSPDTVYGMFVCRGDINSTSCSDCVQTATIEIATNCTLNKRAVIYYQECMVRYSNVSFFSELEVIPSFVLYSLRSAPPNPNQFNQTLSAKFDQLIRNVSSSSLVPYFVQDIELLTQSQGSYVFLSMIQCSPDLDLSNCTVCLQFAFSRVSACCSLPGSYVYSAMMFTPKCLLRYRTLLLPPQAPSPSPLPPPSP